MLEISESLFGFKKDPAAAGANIVDLAKQILDVFHQNQDAGSGRAVIDVPNPLENRPGGDVTTLRGSVI